MIRRTWPTMMLTVVALLGVVAVLLLTGTHTPASARFAITSSPNSATTVTGGSAEFQIQLSTNSNFHGAVALGTSLLPDGVQAQFDRDVVELSPANPVVAVTLSVRVAPTVAPGTLGLGVVASLGRTMLTSTISLQVQPASITDAGPPPAARKPTLASVTVTATPLRVLRPGTRLPIRLVLLNPHQSTILLQRMRVILLSTSKPSCRLADFTIRQFSGHYPVRLPARQAHTLAAFGLPVTNWPQLILLNQPAARAACGGVTVRFKAIGIATTG